ncbi:MAG TPA: hypothetical protein VNE62_06660 [Actinomycetota bacterium]|nr:hypothetical protein [Actinomycetota bacterium]
MSVSLEQIHRDLEAALGSLDKPSWRDVYKKIDDPIYREVMKSLEAFGAIELCAGAHLESGLRSTYFQVRSSEEACGVELSWVAPYAVMQRLTTQVSGHGGVVYTSDESVFRAGAIDPGGALTDWQRGVIHVVQEAGFRLLNEEQLHWRVNLRLDLVEHPDSPWTVYRALFHDFL